ncbi:MAG TPA: hypothetical protein DCO77_02310 [Nitrospiraceae bacterium]|nr:hypothetical protein [Nitrospiraceae bacterium]
MTTGKRLLIAKGKGYLSAAGPQARFIRFFILVLIAYTLLLLVFQKLADILNLPLFLPISLVALLVFIGVVGTLYSHRFLGPIFRIRSAIDKMCTGDLSINLRLRENDDPTLRDLANAVSLLCEKNRNNHTLIQDAVTDLFNDLQGLNEKIAQGADKAALRSHAENVLKKRDALEKALKAHRTT